MPLFKSWKIGEGMFAIWKVAIEGFIERGIPL